MGLLPDPLTACSAANKFPNVPWSQGLIVGDVHPTLALGPQKTFLHKSEGPSGFHGRKGLLL